MSIISAFEIPTLCLLVKTWMAFFPNFPSYLKQVLIIVKNADLIGLGHVIADIPCIFLFVAE